MSRRAPAPRQEKDAEATGRQAIRRRLHTTTTSRRRRRSSAFRERLQELDMAEARREIAAALRVHRASSRNGVMPHEEHHLPQNLQQPQQVQQQWTWPPPPSMCYYEYDVGSSSSNAFFSGHPDLEHHHLASGQLPAPPLGLNLSLHGLLAAGASVYKYNEDDANKDGTRSNGVFGRPLIQLPCAPAVSAAARSANPVVAEELGGAMADDGARWLQDDGGGSGDQEGVVVTAGTPDGGQLETCLDAGYCCWWPQRGGDAQDITLPCMEIGEIEGWDAEWFA